MTLRHENGRHVCMIHGPTNTEMRGGTITMSFFDVSGKPILGSHVEKMAAGRNISLRTGCFCNPGAGETAFGLDEEYMRKKFADRNHLPFEKLAAEIRSERGVDVSGWMSAPYVFRWVWQPTSRMYTGLCNSRRV